MPTVAEKLFVALAVASSLVSDSAAVKTSNGTTAARTDEALQVAAEPSSFSMVETVVADYDDPYSYEHWAKLGAECFTSNKQYGGQLSKVLTSRSSLGCQQLCESDVNCHFFTVFFELPSLNCFLYRAGATTSDISSQHLVAISGPKRCADTPYSCISTKFDWRGEFLGEEEEAASVEVCKNRCVKKMGCYSFLFAPQTRDCALRGAPGKVAPVKYRDGVKSTYHGGLRSCSGHDWCHFPSYKWDLSADHLLSTVKAETSSQCQRECIKHDDCFYFTYENNKNCYLLKETGSNRILDDVKMLAGAKYCGNYAACKRAGKKYELNHVQVVENIPTEEGCWKKCFANSDCHYWSHNHSSSQCILHNHNGYKESTDDANTTSGPAICGIRKAEGGNVYGGIDW